MTGSVVLMTLDKLDCPLSYEVERGDDENEDYVVVEFQVQALKRLMGFIGEERELAMTVESVYGLSAAIHSWGLGRFITITGTYVQWGPFLTTHGKPLH